MAYIVVDTDVVSFGFRQDTLFIDFYGPALVGNRAIISFMTVAELKYGALNHRWGDKRRHDPLAYLDRHYVQYGVSDRLCEIWAEVTWEAKQQGRVIHGADAWIAATAIAVGAPLMTHNRRDFEFLSGLASKVSLGRATRTVEPTVGAGRRFSGGRLPTISRRRRTAAAESSLRA